MGCILWLAAGCAAYGGTVHGNLLGPSGLPVQNGVLRFRLQQAGLAIGTGAIAQLSSQCYTSADGSVVGLPNPLAAPAVTVTYGTGTLPAGTYYVQTAYYTLGSTATLPSPEAVVQLTAQGSVTVAAPPGGVPAGATGLIAYAGTVSGGEVSQGQTTGNGSLVLAQPLQGIPPGTGPFGSNNTVCSLAFNDTIIPYSGYQVALLSSAGNAYPGWPQTWQLNGGLAGTVDVSAGAPLWNGVVIYPVPILSQPLNHGPQSISGSLNMTGYPLVNAGQVGIGTATPGWPLDVENGPINTSQGYLVGGGGGSAGQCLVSNGSFFGPGSCGGALPALYYQHLQVTGSLLAQEAYANFSGNFSLLDNGGSTRTEIDLRPTSVTAGTYTNPSLTVDSYGRLQGATSGPVLPVQQTVNITSGICATAGSAYSRCVINVTWPNATLFTSGNYGLQCQVVGVPSGVLTALYVSNKTATTFQITLQNGTSGGAVVSTAAEIDCHGSF